MPEVNEVKFVQPDKKKHEYVSVDPEGYSVRVNADRKTWSATGPDGMLGETLSNRAGAFKIVNDKVFPPPEGEVAKDGTKKPLITPREHTVLEILETNEGEVSIPVLCEKSTYDPSVAMGIMANLARRKFIVLTANGCTITDVGREARSLFVPGVNVGKGPRVALTPEEQLQREEKRRKAMEEKWGVRADIGPSPTNVEYETARLVNSEASLAWAEIDYRMHPYSKIAAKKVDGARERVKMAEERLVAVKAKAEKASQVPAAE